MKAHIYEYVQCGNWIETNEKTHKQNYMTPFVLFRHLNFAVLFARFLLPLWIKAMLELISWVTWHSHSIHSKFKRFQWNSKWQRQKNSLFWNSIALSQHAFVYSLSNSLRFSGKNKWSHLHCVYEVNWCKNWIVSGDLTFETRIDWDFRWFEINVLNENESEPAQRAHSLRTLTSYLILNAEFIQREERLHATLYNYSIKICNVCCFVLELRWFGFCVWLNSTGLSNHLGIYPGHWTLCNRLIKIICLRLCVRYGFLERRATINTKCNENSFIQWQN